MPLHTAQIEDVFVPREENIKSILESILNLNLNHEENEKVIVNTINQLLGQAKHRKEGLDYLMLILENCSSDTIAKNAVLWISNCIVKYSDDILREQKLRALAKLIENAYNEVDFNKKFVSEYISKVVDTCLETVHVNPYECKAALTTLTTCMKYYPSWFTSHRQTIEKFLLIFLDKDNEELVRGAAQGFHYLQQVGGAGAEGINHKANFTKNFHKLCETVNNLFNKLLEGDTEIFQTATSNEEVFEFQDDFLTQNVTYTLARRIQNCLTYIEFMIRTKFSVAKEIRPKKLIELITRGTSLHRCISKEQKSLDACQSSLILTGVQVKLLRILRLFIIWFGNNSLPFAYPISKILVDNLERCQNCDCFKHESLYQESVYKAIDEWLKICKSSLHTNFQEQLVKCILKDITPVKTQVTLNISEGAAKGESAKSKRKSIENKIISSGQPQRSRKLTLLEQTNAINNCKFALGTLKCLLQSSRLDIKSGLLKEIYKSVYDIVANLQLSKPVHPYTDTACQAKLYEVLVAFYHQDQLSVLPPLQTTLDFLTRGANNNNRFISSICERGVQTLQVLCQPVCPSLYGGSKPPTEENDVPENVLANGLDIEFSPERSLEPERPEIITLSEGESAVSQDTNRGTEDIEVVNYEVNEAENDNNTNMEIEQQAEIQRAESVHSDASIIVNVSDDDVATEIEIIDEETVIEDKVVEEIFVKEKVVEEKVVEEKVVEEKVVEEKVVKEKVVEEIAVELDSEEPPSKKHKPEETDEDDVFEEKKGYNLRSKTKQTAELKPAIAETKKSNDAADVSPSAGTDQLGTIPEVKDNAESNTEVVELEEDDFVDKVLNSFVDEVKEY